MGSLFWTFANLMTMWSNNAESLDILESWVTELFANVRKGPQAQPKFQAQGPIWKAGKIYRLEAVKDVHILDLTWTLPCLRQDYLKKSEDYLAHLLGHGKKILYFLVIHLLIKREVKSVYMLCNCAQTCTTYNVW